MFRLFSSVFIGIALLLTLLFSMSSLSKPLQATEPSLVLEYQAAQAISQSLTATVQSDAAQLAVDPTFAPHNNNTHKNKMLDPARLRDQMLEMAPLDRAAELPVKGRGTGKIYAASLAEPTGYLQQGDQLEWLVYDSVCGLYSPEMFTVRAISSHAEVWVQNDLGYKHYDDCTNYNLTDNPIHPDAKDAEYITNAVIDSLLDQFENNIWPTNIDYFGAYDAHDGTLGGTYIYNIPQLITDNGERVIILISNIRDENFYDPAENPGFIAGFYSPYFEGIADRNMLTLDSKQWNIRQGAPYYMYDSTLAHELQHLIHNDYDNAESTWVNEGLSEYAEFLVGYRTSTNHGRSKWQERPENSLTEWGDQQREEITADYQMAYLFIMYVAGRLGGDAQALTDMAALTRHPDSGFLGFDAWLLDIGSTLTFHELYGDFRLHMLHGGDTTDSQPQSQWNAGYIDNYVSPLMNSGGNPTSAFALGHLRDSFTFEGYSSAGVPPFGTDYIEIGYSDAITGAYPIYFEGLGATDDTTWRQTPIVPDSVPASAGISATIFHSGHTDENDNFAIFGPFTLASGGSVDANMLTFDHFYNIERDWDFGFVQVTTDTTGFTGWTSLSMTGMQTVTNASANSVIKANLPGYSGLLPGWQSASVDLSPFAGKPMLLAFRYSTDGGTAGNIVSGFDPGWAIANAKIGSTPLNYSSAQGIYEIRNIPSTSYVINFVTYADGYGEDIANIYTLTLSSDMTGTLDLGAIALADDGFNEPGERGILLVTSDPTVDATPDLIGSGYQPTYADYRLTNVPPGINTSDADIDGNAVGFKGVYPSGTITATISIDNIGASPSITATQAITGVACARIPDNATINRNSETSGAAYTPNMNTVGLAFPADPGVCYTGAVARTLDYTFTMTADASLPINERVVLTTYFASDVITVPEQLEVDVDSLTVRAPFALSVHTAAAESYPTSSIISFTTTAINLDDGPRSAVIAFVLPDNTTFDRIEATGTYTVSVADSNIVFIQDTIGAYDFAGSREYTFFIQTNTAIVSGQTIKSFVSIRDVASDQEVWLSDAARIEGTTLFLPFTPQ